MTDAQEGQSPPLPPPSFPAPAPMPPPPPGPPGFPPASYPVVGGAELPSGVEYASPWGRLGCRLLEGLLMVVTLYVGWVIWAIVIAGDGQTPAKKLLNYRVVDTGDKRPVGFARMFWMRGVLCGIVVGFATIFTLGVILFMPFWDKRNQNLWDKVSDTYVVRDPGNMLAVNAR